MTATLSNRFGNVSHASCLSRRGNLLLTVLFSFIAVLLLVSFGTSVGFPNVTDLSFISGYGSPDPMISGCSTHHPSADLDLWREARTKYADLSDEKFT